MAKREKLIEIWNGEFPQHPLTVADMKKPHCIMGAVLLIFNRLGINVDNVLTLPPEEERDSHTVYYADLLPVINMTRVVNHLVESLKQYEICPMIKLTSVLQPDIDTSHSILLMLINAMAFNESRMRDIEPYEEELFGLRDQVASLEEQVKGLIEMLNERAAQKGKRAERLAKIDQETKQLEEELKHEKELHALEKQDLEAVLEEKRQTEILLEQKKSHREALMAEVARKRALRVYDADDIKAQAEQTAQNVQEAEEKLNSLKATLMQKENSLKNLQKIKPNLDLANNLLHEVMKLSENLKDLKTGDLDTESKEGELDVLNMDLSELQSQLSELQAAKQEFNQKRAENETKRQQQRTHLHNALREAEENEKKNQEKTKRSLLIIEEIKRRTIEYEAEKKKAVEELDQTKKDFCLALKSYENALLKKTSEAEEKIMRRLQDRR